MEEFRQIEDYPDYYISNYGNVKSTKKSKGKKERILKPIKIKGGYLLVNINNEGGRKLVYIHHLVGRYFLNHVSNGWERILHHIDGDKTNNNLDNLTVTSPRDNMFRCYNKKPNKTSSYIGVHYKEGYKNPWIAQIGYDGTSHYLGLFATEQEAANAYQEALMKHLQNKKK